MHRFIPALKTLVQLSRPRFWPYLAGPYLIGYAAFAESPAAYTRPDFWLLLLYFFIPANILIYGVNDYFDRDTDVLNAKKDGKEIRVHARNESLYRNAILVSFLCAIPLAFLLPWKATGALFLFLSLGIGYSTPPFRFKARPVLDSVSNFLYAVPGLVGAYQLSIEGPPVPVLIAALCWTAAMHLFSAVPDINADTKAGVRTSAVAFGKRTSLIICIALWILAGGISTSVLPVLAFTLFYALIPAFLLIRPVADVSRVYWLFPYINLATGFVVFWSIALL